MPFLLTKHIYPHSRYVYLTKILTRLLSQCLLYLNQGDASLDLLPGSLNLLSSFLLSLLLESLFLLEFLLLCTFLVSGLLSFLGSEDRHSV